MSLKQRIEEDLKKALLAGDKIQATTLRGLKSAILNEEISKGLREKGLDDDAVIGVLKREIKSRIESIDLYRKGDRPEQAEKEEQEKAVIEKYMPEQMSPEELSSLVDDTIKSTSGASMSSMGQIIGAVKQKAGPAADGSQIAELVKQKLGNL